MSKVYPLGNRGGGSGEGTPGPRGPAGLDGKTPIKGVDYFDGVDGKNGKDGINGLDGERGLSGIDGYTPIKEVDYTDGKDGERGTNGVDGSNGIDGKDGLTGERGSAGADGKDGIQGPQGVPGKDGLNGYTPIKEIDYFDGEKGEKGDTGAGVSIIGTLASTEELPDLGELGNAYLIGGNLHVWNGVAWENVGNIKGPKGDTGEDGRTPTKGVDYFDGEKGDTGERGDIGLTGIDGLQGEPGVDGYTPVKGVDYLDGIQGASGKDGYTPQKGIDYFDGERGPAGEDGSSTVDLTPYATKVALKAEEDARLLHESKKIHEGELHGLRIVDDALEIFNGSEWLDIKGGGGGSGIPLGNVENLTATENVGLKINISWKDPADVVLEEIPLAKWNGTILRRKEGTYPVDEKDGVLVVDNKVRDAYSVTGYSDTGLTDGVTYYYALFPYTDGGLVTVDNTNRVTSTAIEKRVQTLPSKPVASKLQQNKATVTSDVGSVVSLDKADWFASPHEFTGLTDGQSYTPYAKVTATATHFESAIATGTAFTAVNKLPKAAPTAPVISTVKFDRATITSEAGTIVSINQTNWFPIPHEFTGLTAEKAYVAYAKYEESSTHLESPVSQKAFTTPSTVSIYGVKIDTANSNPETAVTYTDDAIGFASQANFENVYPFNVIKPVMFKNGLEVYDIDPNDYSKKLSGGAIGVNDGDVMIRFPKVWWKIERIGTIQHVKYATAKVDATYKCLAHTKNGVEKDYSYIGAYLGYEQAGKLRSVSGKLPTATKTIGQFRTLAQANGVGYQQISYYQILMMQVLYLVRYKNRDSQTAVGRGYVDGNAAATTTGGTNAKGMTFGETTGKQQMKLFGVEDFWGNLRQWIDGMYSDDSYNILVGDKDFNDTGVGYTNYGVGASANVSGYITDIQGGTETGFITKFGAGSETTHYADQGLLYAGRLPIFGGAWADAGTSGAFYLRVAISASYSFASIGSRCCFI